MGQGLSLKMPSPASKNTGVINVINAAKTQCTLAPNDCPRALILLGNISAIKTQIWVDVISKMDFDFLNILNNLFIKSTHEPQTFF